MGGARFFSFRKSNPLGTPVAQQNMDKNPKKERFTDSKKWKANSGIQFLFLSAVFAYICIKYLGIYVVSNMCYAKAVCQKTKVETANFQVQIRTLPSVSVGGGLGSNFPRTDQRVDPSFSTPTGRAEQHPNQARVPGEDLVFKIHFTKSQQIVVSI